MDPGHQLLQKLKLVPNLVNEDPSITTPVIMLMLWSLSQCQVLPLYSLLCYSFSLDEHLIYGDAMVRFLQAFGTTEQESLCFK